MILLDEYKPGGATEPNSGLDFRQLNKYHSRIYNR